jgi:hypothetical protein
MHGYELTLLEYTLRFIESIEFRVPVLMHTFLAPLNNHPVRDVWRQSTNWEKYIERSPGFN